jgi:molybdopterin synthase catalytic subunit
MSIDINAMIAKIKRHPRFSEAGMILAHNGVVRESSRDGRKVTGLCVAVDHAKLDTILEEKRRLPGIIEILVEIVEDRDLAVGEDVMGLVVAGDIRENVIAALSDTLNTVKSVVTSKTEFFVA